MTNAMSSLDRLIAAQIFMGNDIDNKEVFLSHPRPNLILDRYTRMPPKQCLPAVSRLKDTPLPTGSSKIASKIPISRCIAVQGS